MVRRLAFLAFLLAFCAGAILMAGLLLAPTAAWSPGARLALAAALSALGLLWVVMGQVAVVRRLLERDADRQDPLHEPMTRIMSLVMGAAALIYGATTALQALAPSEPALDPFLDATTVSPETAWLFVVDQVAGAAMLDLPEAYGWRWSALRHDPSQFWLATAVFSFRTAMAGVAPALVAALVGAIRTGAVAPSGRSTQPDGDSSRSSAVVTGLRKRARS